MTMFMLLEHQVQVKMDDSHRAAYMTESWIKIYIIWVIKQSLELIPTHFDCINIWFSLPHLLNSPISGPRASRLGPHIGGQRTAYSNGEPRVSWQLSGWISGSSGSRVRSGRTPNQSEAQICAAEETKCAVRGPLVPSRWGGLQYNGGCQTNSSGQQRTAWHHFLPLTRGPQPCRHFSGAAQQQFSGLYKSASRTIQGRHSWTQTEWRCFNGGRWRTSEPIKAAMQSRLGVNLTEEI